MDSFIVDIEDNIVLCYTNNNIIVNKNLYDMCDQLPYDICNMIGEYYNGFAIALFIESTGTTTYYTINIANEYIDFKQINYNGRLSKQCCEHGYGSSQHIRNYWCWTIQQTINPTILISNNNSWILLKIFSEYVKQHRMNIYFNTYISPWTNTEVTVQNNIITTAGTKINVIDHELFIYLALIHKKILDKYNYF